MKEPKFKVGDYTTSIDSEHSRYMIINNVTDSNYYYSVYGRENDTFVFKSTFNILNYDSQARYYYKKIKDTKIARKLNHGKIYKEEGDYIWVCY